MSARDDTTIFEVQEGAALLRKGIAKLISDFEQGCGGVRIVNLKLVRPNTWNSNFVTVTFDVLTESFEARES